MTQMSFTAQLLQAQSQLSCTCLILKWAAEHNFYKHSPSSANRAGGDKVAWQATDLAGHGGGGEYQPNGQGGLEGHNTTV